MARMHKNPVVDAILAAEQMRGAPGMLPMEEPDAGGVVEPGRKMRMGDPLPPEYQDLNDGRGPATDGEMEYLYGDPDDVEVAPEKENRKQPDRGNRDMAARKVDTKGAQQLDENYTEGGPPRMAPTRRGPSEQPDEDMGPGEMSPEMMDELMQMASRNAISKKYAEVAPPSSRTIENMHQPDSGELQDYMDANGEMPERMIRNKQDSNDNRDPESNSYNRRRKGPQRRA